MRNLVWAALVAAGCSASGTSGSGTQVHVAGLGGALAASDDASSFTLVQAGSSVDLWSLAQAGSDAWLVGDAGTILHSGDGGGRWTAQVSGTSAALRQVAFRDASHGLAIGIFGSILSTSDGGATWISTPAEGKEQPSAATASPSSWWVASELGGLWRSSDEARTFVKQSVPDGVFRAIAFDEGGTVGCAVGENGVVIATTDGGATWAKRETATATLRSVAIGPTGDEIVAVGARGLSWRSSDRGAHFAAGTSGVGVDLYGVTFDRDGALYVVGTAGTILVASSASGPLRAAASPSTATWTAVAARAE